MTLLRRIARRLGVGKPRLADSAAKIDFADPAISRNPFPHYARLRAEATVCHLAHHDAWIVLGYDEVKSALAQPGLFSNEHCSAVDAVLLAADPPAHAAVRHRVARLFNATTLADLGAAAARWAPTLIAREMDAAAYAKTLSRKLAARLIGFDDATLAEMASALSASTDRPPSIEYIVATIDRLAPRASLIATLTDDHELPLNDGQARSLVRLLWIAATLTTERAIAQSILRLVQDPGLQTAIAADRTLLPPFIDEILRLHPPELMVLRVAQHATSLGGAAISRGAHVYLCLAAANRDPARFEVPDTLWLDRPTMRHFAFGGGIHHCVGAPLARRIVAIAVGALLDAGKLVPREPLDQVALFTSITVCAPVRLAIAVGECAGALDGAGS